MIGDVELTGENPDLARLELQMVCESIGGRLEAVERRAASERAWATIEVSAPEALVEIARRLALGRRCLLRWPVTSEASLTHRFEREGASGVPAEFRWRRSPGPSGNLRLDRLASAYVHGGGVIDLRRPARRFWLSLDASDGVVVSEEVAEVDRSAFEDRRMPRLPFRRPVSLPPRLARAAANLSGAGPGVRVVDPFLGTGALLLEAALLGARISGIDREPKMVRGALKNLAQFGVAFERVRVGDAEEAAAEPEWGPFDAILSDPPYGRASSAGGEPVEVVVARVIPAWANRIRRGGRIVLVLPGGPDPLPSPWRRTAVVPHRTHGSLIREFRIYRREEPDGSDVSGS